MVPFPPSWGAVPDPRQRRTRRRKRIIGGVLGGLLAAGLMAIAIISIPETTIRAEFEPETFTELQLDSSGEWLLFASSNATDIACQATGPDGTAAELSTLSPSRNGPPRTRAADGTVMVAVFEVQVPDPGTYTLACTGPDGAQFAIGPPRHWLLYLVFLVSAILVIVGTALTLSLSAMFQSLPSSTGPWPGPPGWSPTGR